MKDPGRAAVVLAFGALLVALVPVLAVGEEDMVVISRPGVVFHRVGSADVCGRGIEKGLDQALSAGYIPCRVCFGKATGMAPLMGPTALSASSLPGGQHVIVPRGQLGSTVISQPNGVQSGVLYESGVGRGGVRNPYDPVQTVTQPGKEQGAYGGQAGGGSRH